MIVVAFFLVVVLFVRVCFLQDDLDELEDRVLELEKNNGRK